MHSKAKFVTFVVMAVAALAGPARLVAQQATVQGAVTDKATNEPLAGVQILVPGTALFAQTDATGRYRLTGVPAGPVRVVVRIIGFESSEQTLQAVAGESVTANFSIGRQALALDEIVVTGTPGGTQMKAIGNVVNRVDAAQLKLASPASDFTQFLGEKAPGVVLGAPHGMVGTGTNIQIRGVSSMQLSGQPLLFVDGVRVNNDASTGPALRGGQLGTRLNDFNPEDIESIEIIKGPAAATIYGTEASAGVIQIITKKGARGSPAIDFTVRMGQNYLQNPEGRFFTTYNYIPATGQLDSMNIYKEYEATTGRPIFTNGLTQSYTASMRGGTDLFRYYTSVDYNDDVGIVDYNWQKQFSTRANLSLHPTQAWDLSVNLGFVRSHTRFAQAATGFGVWEAIAWTNPNTRGTTTKGFRYAPPEAMAKVDSRSRTNRFTGSFTINHRPITWLDQRLVVGLDYSNDVATQLFPMVPPGDTNYYGAAGAGQKRLDSDNALYSSVDWAATAKFNLLPTISSATSVGAQYTQRENAGSFAFGLGFPSPTITTVSGAAVTQGGESWEQNKTLGTFIQEQISWRDRVFLTAAVRADANSAFGADYDAAYYPKFSATWVVSDEAFWRFAFVNQLRLRTAWGQAGMQPGVFDAVTLYGPVTGPGNTSVLTPRTLGNPTLKPEVGEELEVGFDAAFINQRLTLNYTFYNKLTKDALVAQPVRPSVGFPGTQLVNIGQIHNWGHEIATNLSVLNGRMLGLDLGVTFSTHKNIIDDMGGVPTQGGSGNRNRVGYPISTHFAKLALSGQLVGGVATNMMCDGGTGPYGLDQGGQPVPCATAPEVAWGSENPTWSGGVTVGIRVGPSLKLNALAEGKGGHQLNSMIAGAHRTMFSTRPVNPITDPRMAAYLTQLSTDVTGRYKAGFVRMRELSALYTLPQSVAGLIGAESASLMVGWRNAFFLWVQQKEVWQTKVFDAEQSGTAIAPTSAVVTTVRVTL